MSYIIHSGPMKIADPQIKANYWRLGFLAPGHGGDQKERCEASAMIACPETSPDEATGQTMCHFRFHKVHDDVSESPLDNIYCITTVGYGGHYLAIYIPSEPTLRLGTTPLKAAGDDEPSPKARGIPPVAFKRSVLEERALFTLHYDASAADFDSPTPIMGYHPMIIKPLPAQPTDLVRFVDAAPPNRDVLRGRSFPTVPFMPVDDYGIVYVSCVTGGLPYAPLVSPSFYTFAIRSAVEPVFMSATQPSSIGFVAKSDTSPLEQTERFVFELCPGLPPNRFLYYIKSAAGGNGEYMSVESDSAGELRFITKAIQVTKKVDDRGVCEQFELIPDQKSVGNFYIRCPCWTTELPYLYVPATGPQANTVQAAYIGKAPAPGDITSFQIVCNATDV